LITSYDRNCLQKHISKGKTEGGTEFTTRRGRRSKQLLDKLKEARGSTRSHFAENSLWTCRKTDYGIIMIVETKQNVTVTYGRMAPRVANFSIIRR
jgi:hypothetical protein